MALLVSIVRNILDKLMPTTALARQPTSGSGSGNGNGNGNGSGSGTIDPVVLNTGSATGGRSGSGSGSGSANATNSSATDAGPLPGPLSGSTSSAPIVINEDAPVKTLPAQGSTSYNQIKNYGYNPNDSSQPR
jgi:hypothetical protein